MCYAMGINMKKEKYISNYIDRLNKERKPKNTFEEREIQETVKMIKSLKEVEYPDSSFEKKLLNSIKKQEVKKKSLLKRVVPVTAAAVVIAGMALFYVYQPQHNTNVVYAMEKAYTQVKAYHGIQEILSKNEAGEENLISKRDIWADSKGRYYIKEAGNDNYDIITINNGDKKWQINTEESLLNVLKAFPDNYTFAFELGDEIDNTIKAGSVKSLGKEDINGVHAKVLQITPNGGDAYKLWVDEETNIPMQKETAMVNGISYIIRYTQLQIKDTIPNELLTYQVPQDYQIVERNPEQVVNTLEEAAGLAGFTPKNLENEIPGYTLKKISVETNNNAVKLLYTDNLDKNKIVINEQLTNGELKISTGSIIGKVNLAKAEIIVDSAGLDNTFYNNLYKNEKINSVRWQEDGREFSIEGNVSLDMLSSFIREISLGELDVPETTKEVTGEITVPYDISVEEATQKQVDAGHSPWKLDPAYVTQVFVSLLISPEGIVGDYPIDYDNIEITENNGVTATAVIHDKKSPAKTVYLKRLVRTDESGIWTVVGYDKADE